VKVDRKELQARMDHFRQAFEQTGAKMTHQRIEVFREVARTDEHPDAVTIYRRVRRRMPTISLDTVYRTLWKFLDMGLITTLGFYGERVRFDGNTARHHHFICNKCGMTMDLKSEELDNLKAPSAAKDLGNIETTHVEFRGLCVKCSKDYGHGSNRGRRHRNI
jgi:Fur family peroxide stress response transcriptional regulator